MATSRSFKQFSRRMNIRADEVVKGVERKIRRAAIKVDQAVVLGTPFDTGRAKSNWIVGIGVPRFEINEPLATNNQAQTEQQAIANATAQIGQFKLGDRKIFLTNSLPYIEELENGSSAQAPQGFVQQAIKEGQQAFQFGKVFK